MRNGFVSIRPLVEDHGMRLRIQEDDGVVLLVEERTLPERVTHPDAHRKSILEQIVLDSGDVEWLHEALGEILWQRGHGDRK